MWQWAGSWCGEVLGLLELEECDRFVETKLCRYIWKTVNNQPSCLESAGRESSGGPQHPDRESVLHATGRKKPLQDYDAQHRDKKAIHVRLEVCRCLLRLLKMTLNTCISCALTMSCFAIVNWIEFSLQPVILCMNLASWLLWDLG